MFEDSQIKFKFIDNENDILFHKAYIMLCEIFGGMMPYRYFRQYEVSVALCNDQCVAFMLVKFPDDIIDSDEDNTKSNIINIASLGVLEKYRGKGIADKYIKWLKDLHPKNSFNLHVSVKNKTAINLYIRNGFKIINTKYKYYMEETFEPYIGEGINAHEMLCK